MSATSPVPPTQISTNHMTVESFGKQVGRRIWELRKRAGVTQSARAEPLGMTFQQISKYENGRIGNARPVALARSGCLRATKLSIPYGVAVLTP